MAASPATAAQAAAAEPVTTIEAAHVDTDGMARKTGKRVKAHRHAHHARACGVVSPSPAGWCPAYHGPLAVRTEISFGRVYRYAYWGNGRWQHYRPLPWRHH